MSELSSPPITLAVLGLADSIPIEVYRVIDMFVDDFAA
jgi:hypothetical protein